MRYASLRKKVEKKLGWKLDDRAWFLLEDYGLVTDADLTGDLKPLLRKARSFSAPGSSQRPKPRLRGRIDAPTVTAGSDSVARRAQALSELLADEASTDRRVLYFRRRFLGGTTTIHDVAERLFDSPAAAIGRAEWFEKGGVPLRDHESRVLKEQRADCGWPRPGCDWVRVDLAIRFGEAEMATFVVDSPSRRRIFAYRSGDHEEIARFVADESPLAHLRDLSEALAGEYRWRVPEAAAFVLEGVAPKVPSIEVSTSFHVGPRDRQQAAITLTVSPAVPVSDVARAYRDAQLAVLPQLGRAPSDRTVEAVGFVARYQRLHPQSTWQERMDAFNEAHTSPFLTVHSFIQAVERGREDLLINVQLPPRLGSLLPSMKNRRWQ